HNVPAPTYRAVLKELRGIRSFVLCCAGMTASTFVLGGVATVMQLYIFEREARFTLDASAVDRLDALKLTNGERVIGSDTIDKLRRAAGSDDMTAAELRAKLVAALTQEELENDGAFVFKE